MVKIILKAILSSFKGRWLNLKVLCYSPNLNQILKILVGCIVIGVAVDALADNGTDILANTNADLIATLNGSGKKYLYMAEMFTAIATYMKTKNIFILGGIVVVAVAINAMLKLAT